MHSFNKGDRVHYYYEGQPICGEIIRVNSRYASNPSVRMKKDGGGEVTVQVDALKKGEPKAKKPKAEPPAE